MTLELVRQQKSPFAVRFDGFGPAAQLYPPIVIEPPAVPRIQLRGLTAAAAGYVEPAGIGISWLWQLPDTHWAYWCAVWHDCGYDLRRFLTPGSFKMRINDFVLPAELFYAAISPTSELLDRGFRARMRARARTSFQHFTAEAWYPVIRTWGTAKWPEFETNPAVRDLYVVEAVKKLKLLKLMGEI